MRMYVEEMESFCYNSDENEIIGNNRGRGMHKYSEFSSHLYIQVLM